MDVPETAADAAARSTRVLRMGSMTSQPLLNKKFKLMTKNNSHDEISSCGLTHSFSEIAEKSGRGFAYGQASMAGGPHGVGYLLCPRTGRDGFGWLQPACFRLAL